MIYFLMLLIFSANLDCSLDRVEILSQIPGKSLHEAIVELKLKESSFHLGGGMDNSRLGYCGFYDGLGNHVVLWIEVPNKIILPSAFLTNDLEKKRYSIFESILNNKVYALSVGNGRSKVSKRTSVLPAINACNGQQVEAVLNTLELKNCKKTGYFDFLNNIYLIRVLDSRNLVFEFQIDEEELPNIGRKVKYRHLRSKKFKFLRIFTGRKINLRGYVYNLEGLN